jgi:membrane protease YdiL (CAAX protease family)
VTGALVRLRSLSAAQEALVAWALSFLAIVVSFLVMPGVAKGVATVGFLYLPLLWMSARGEGHSDYGVTLKRWRYDLKLFVIAAGVILPLYLGAYLAFLEVLPRLPSTLAHLISPYAGAPKLSATSFTFRLPSEFPLRVLDELLVVALPEEFFYRGFLLTRLTDAWPEGRRVLGVRMGKAFFLTAALFALGHLAIFQAWRLAVFFPALLFAWMRLKSGTVFGAVLLHAFCNLYEQVLRASLIGPF